MPWSILHYPYVKAAILSTYKDDPCGPCQQAEETNQDNKQLEDVHENRNRTMENLVKNEIILPVTNKAEHSNHEHRTEANNVTTAPVEPTTVQNSTAAIDTKIAVENTNTTTNGTETNKQEVKNDYAEIQGDEARADEEFEDFSKISKPNKNVKTRLDYPDYLNHEKMEYRSPALGEIIQMVHTNGNEDRASLLWKKKNEKKFKGKSSNDIDSSKKEILDNEITPLRIILKYPHSHSSGKNLTVHDYVVLEAGNPKYHGHIDEKPSNSAPDNVRFEYNVTQDALLKEFNISAQNFVNSSFPEVLSEAMEVKPTTELASESITNPDEFKKSDFLNTIWRGASFPKNVKHQIPEERSDASGKDDHSAKPDEKTSKDQSSDAFDKLVVHYSKLLSWVYYPL